VGFCEKITTDVVVCDEIFYFEHDEINVPLGFDAPPGSVLSGVVTVTLSECDVFIVGEGTLVADVLFIVQKELLLTTPAGDVFPLEFVERLRFVEPFRKCGAGVLELLNLQPEQLRCQIVRTAGRDTITLDTDNDTLSEELTIELKIKVTSEVQQFIKLCPPRHTVDIPIAAIQ
jgi:hypothetical protein